MQTNPEEKGGKKEMKTQMEDIRNNANILPNRNDIRSTADINKLSEMPEPAIQKLLRFTTI